MLERYIHQLPLPLPRRQDSEIIVDLTFIDCKRGKNICASNILIVYECC